MVHTLWLITVGYLLGSIPFAFILARWWGGIDLRTSGSGNVGTTNVFRTTGTIAGLCTLALDVGKGAVAVLVAQHFGSDPTGATVAGVAAVTGHIFPIWLGFRGGKGVATSCGVFAVLAPLATAIVSGLFVVTVWRTRYVSLGSVVGAVLMGPITYVTGAPPTVLIGAVIAAAMIVERHRGNLHRVFAGTERRFGSRA